jgi:hypothetical protein
MLKLVATATSIIDLPCFSSSALAFFLRQHTCGRTCYQSSESNDEKESVVLV